MIKYYDRKNKNYLIEKVADDKYLNWIYSSPIGMKFLELLIKKKFFSKTYGKYCDYRLSTKKIAPFVEEFNLNMDHSEKNINDFSSFNDFFTRKLKPSARAIDLSPESLLSPGDGKLVVFKNIDLKNVVQIKGFNYSLLDLIDDPITASKYENGICMILRLCPTDYHRFHFLDSGICGDTTKIEGNYYSVNPVALSKIPQLFCKNKRSWSILKSDNFGDVLYVEVGATCVGSIIQTYTPNKRINKGDEKGFFKFGGSTIVMFFQKNKIEIHQDIINQTNLGYETSVLMGETIGNKL